MQLKILKYLDSKEAITYFGQLHNTYRYVICDYSSFDIPTGTVFNKLIMPDSNSIPITAILKEVTQQYRKAFEWVPMGWKTVCAFDFKVQVSFNNGLIAWNDLEQCILVA